MTDYGVGCWKDKRYGRGMGKAPLCPLGTHNIEGKCYECPANTVPTWNKKTECVTCDEWITRQGVCQDKKSRSFNHYKLTKHVDA